MPTIVNFSMAFSLRTSSKLVLKNESHLVLATTTSFSLGAISGCIFQVSVPLLYGLS